MQVTTELTHVEDSSAAKQGPEDSFSRVGYHRESELAVNQQIKWVLAVLYLPCPHVHRNFLHVLNKQTAWVAAQCCDVLFRAKE